MDRKTDRQYSILIVSASEKFNTLVKRSIPINSFNVIEVRSSISQASRELLSRKYDITVINAPLPDDIGINFAIDVSSRYASGTMLVTPGEICDEVTDHVLDYGVIAVPKPINKSTISSVIRHLLADQDKIKNLEKKLSQAEDKLDEMRIVIPNSWDNLLSNVLISFIPKGSRPLIGSSRISSSGLCIMAAAIPRRCFIPNEKSLNFFDLSLSKFTI